MKPRVFCIIMGGGRGARLHPLTTLRAKPAVPLGGKYRLVDIPLSNCLHSGIYRISVLTQFNTASLHHHIQDTYRFDAFRGGYVDILAAEQTDDGTGWYQGTADAVRQNLRHFHATDDDLFLILSGDQLYRMDFEELVAHHLALRADVTIATKPMSRCALDGLGLVHVDNGLRIHSFVEKPSHPETLADVELTGEQKKDFSLPPSSSYAWANMGIYVFNKQVLWDALTHNECSDFSKEVIPKLLADKRLFAYPFTGYWQDIGTVRAFFDANLALTDPDPPFDFFENKRTVFTHPRFLPSSRIAKCQIDQAIVADGCQLDRAILERCVIGIRSIVRPGSFLKDVVVMGQDHYGSKTSSDDRPAAGIGTNCTIYQAIIDKNARIGNDTVLSPLGLPDGYEQGDVMVRDGVLVVTKNGVVPAGTRIGTLPDSCRAPSR